MKRYLAIGGFGAALAGAVLFAIVAWTAIGLIWYFIVRSQSPHIAQQVGRRFENVPGLRLFE